MKFKSISLKKQDTKETIHMFSVLQTLKFSWRFLCHSVLQSPCVYSLQGVVSYAEITRIVSLNAIVLRNTYIFCGSLSKTNFLWKNTDLSLCPFPEQLAQLTTPVLEVSAHHLKPC